MMGTEIDTIKAKGVRLWALIWWPDGMWPKDVRYWDGKSEVGFKRGRGLVDLDVLR